jgi:L,D-transpeptidase ErfK/SrfK
MSIRRAGGNSGFWAKRFRLPTGVMALAGGIALVAVAIPVIRVGCSTQRIETPAIPPEIAAMNPDALEKQIAKSEARLRQNQEKIQSLFPNRPAILVDSASNQIMVIKDSQVLIQDKCSTGTGFELSDAGGKRTWTFDTPRGFFKVAGKVKNPVWIRPDWAFIEEGLPIPKNRQERAVANVLGDYAIAFGQGYFIHGTLYTRMLGTSVTHGCIRVGDDTLEKIYATVGEGTPIWIY